MRRLIVCAALAAPFWLGCEENKKEEPTAEKPKPSATASAKPTAAATGSTTAAATAAPTTAATAAADE
jgi:hypothetical protein